MSRHDDVGHVESGSPVFALDADFSCDGGVRLNVDVAGAVPVVNFDAAAYVGVRNVKGVRISCLTRRMN